MSLLIDEGNLINYPYREHRTETPFKDPFAGKCIKNHPKPYSKCNFIFQIGGKNTNFVPNML